MNASIRQRMAGTVTDALTALAPYKALAQTQITPAMVELAAGARTSEDVLAQFSGDNLANALAGINLIPNITDIKDQTARPGEARTVDFTIFDYDGPVENLNVTVTSSDELLLPLDNIRLEGAGRDRTLSFTPVANLRGVSELRLTVSDGRATDSSRFKVTVLPRLSVNGQGAIESDGTESNRAVFTVNLDAPSNQTVKVEYTTGGGTAEQETDYLAASALLTFQPGEVAKTIEVELVNDTVVEPDETFDLALDNAINAMLNEQASKATVAITDNDPIISAIADVVTQPGQTAETTFTVRDPRNLGADLQMTLDSSDPTLLPVSAILLEGTDKTRTISVTPSVLLSGVATVTVTINDGQVMASSAFQVIVQPTLAVTGSTAIEQDSGTGPSVNFSVALSVPSNQVVRVSYAATGASAQPDADFAPTEGALEFQPGDTSKIVGVTLVNDTIEEGSEDFKLTLGRPENALLLKGQETATGVILDNDPVATAISDLTTPDGQPVEATFRVTDPAGLGAGLNIAVQSSDATLLPSDQITIRAEGNERTIRLAPVSGRSGQSTITLSVNDGQVVFERSFRVAVLPVITASGGLVVEGDGTANIAMTFTVRLSAISSETVEVQYATGGGTALPGADYLVASGTLTFEPGETSKTVRVTIVNDAAREADQTFNLLLSNPVRAVVPPGQDSASAFIIDNDPVVSPMKDLVAEPGQAVEAFFTVRDPFDRGAALDITVQSSDSRLIPPANISLGGTGPTRTLTLIPWLASRRGGDHSDGQ